MLQCSYVFFFPPFTSTTSIQAAAQLERPARAARRRTSASRNCDTGPSALTLPSGSHNVYVLSIGGGCFSVTAPPAPSAGGIPSRRARPACFRKHAPTARRRNRRRHALAHGCRLHLLHAFALAYVHGHRALRHGLRLSRAHAYHGALPRGQPL